MHGLRDYVEADAHDRDLDRDEVLAARDDALAAADAQAARGDSNFIPSTPHQEVPA